MTLSPGDRARLREDTELLFHHWLDGEWPRWREDHDDKRYQPRLYKLLRKAFFAGAGIEDEFR